MLFLYSLTDTPETVTKGSGQSNTLLPHSGYARILVPLDGSLLAERVLPYACELPKAFGSRVELLNVFSPAPAGLADPAHLRGRSLDYLRRVTASMDLSGIKLSLTAKTGGQIRGLLSGAGQRNRPRGEELRRARLSCLRSR